MADVTVSNLSIQFDIPESLARAPMEEVIKYVRESIELINLALQRGPYGLDAQITPSSVEASIHDGMLCVATDGE